jgi:hypothetical protein
MLPVDLRLNEISRKAIGLQMEVTRIGMLMEILILRITDSRNLIEERLETLSEINSVQNSLLLIIFESQVLRQELNLLKLSEENKTKK